MKKRVLIISSSLRQNSNSHALAEAFARGARASGHDVELVSLIGKKIAFCTGCLACQKAQRCAIRDDAVLIVQKMRDADVIAFATPIYYYEMSGQLKTMLDRANPLFPADYAFRGIYLLATAAENEDTAMEGAIAGLNGWISCFDKAQLKGVVRALGVNAPGAIQGSPALRAAHAMGKSV